MKIFKKIYLFAFLALFVYAAINILSSKNTIYYKYGYINKNGEKVIPAVFYSASDFHNGIAAVSIENKYGYINKQGKPVVNIEHTKTFPVFRTFLLLNFNCQKINVLI